METQVIRYYFRMPDNSRVDFNLALNMVNLELRGNIPEHLPAWTKLGFHQCSICPLDIINNPYCPLATNIVNVVQRFDGLTSYDTIEVEVITEERRITQSTTVQKGISSIMGLIIATCGCPHTSFFKPMARFHLPLASGQETIFRATSMYLLAQYYLKKECRIADFEFEGLRRIYNNMQIVNFAVAERLRNATLSDSSINAIVLLDSYAQVLPLAIDKSIDEICHLFH
ncbi:MAG: DUF6901 family protein, partial [Planctomycetota bacterium]